MSTHTIAHLRTAAKARLPKMVFDFIDGGAGSEGALVRAEQAMNEVCLVPRILTGAEERSSAVTLLGKTWAQPFGVAPIGLGNLVLPGTDGALAAAAAAAGIPYVLSTAATTSIEDIRAVNPDAWFQLYVGRDSALVEDLIARAQAAGVETLIVTADVPAPGKRVRDLVNGFTLPLRPSVGMLLDLVRHPGWCLATLRGGAPRFANLERYAGKGTNAQSLAALMAKQSSARLDWSLLAAIRRRWDGKLIVKGVLNPDDARIARDAGMDAVIVSSHGGRQFAAAPAPLSMLPLVRDAVGDEFPVLMDGGIRSGDDIARALCLGANFVLLGRAFLYAVGASGTREGPRIAIDLLAGEFDNTMAQLGARTIAALRADLVLGHRGREARPGRNFSQMPIDG